MEVMGKRQGLEQALNSMSSNMYSKAVVQMGYKESSGEATREFNTESSKTLETTKTRRSLAGIVYGPPIDALPGHYKKPPLGDAPEPQITRSVGSDFKKNSTNSVLEVLLEEPRVSIRGRLRKTSTIPNNCSNTAVKRDSPIIHQNPHRVRIRSSKLLKVLESVAEIAGYSFITSGTSSIVS